MKHSHPRPAPPSAAAPSATTPAPAPALPTFDTLAADPEIAPLLDFTAVPRQIVKAKGWSPDMQIMFIAWLALYGSPGNACTEIGMARSGVDKLYRSPGAESFRDAWDGAVALAERRRIALVAATPGGIGGLKPPSLANRAPTPSATATDNMPGPAPGQVLNELGDYEDEGSLLARADDARDSISAKLRNARRLYLQEISGDAGKRAAFELLTELPIDWDQAKRREPQPDEPWRRPNMREPDMLLTAENGWMGDFAHGPDKKAELRAAIDEARAEEGLAPVDWSGSTEVKTNDGA